jgi:hypothetical protein
MLASQEAAAELLRRRIIEGDFTDWCRLIPNPIDQNRCAQSRRPMDMIFQG